MLFAFMVFITGSVSAEEPWRDLTRLVPSSANAILVVDVETLFESPLAKTRGWRESHANQFDITPTLLPPDAKYFLLAAEVDVEHFEPKWEFAAMELSRQISMQEICERLDGRMDVLAGNSVVLTPRGSFIVPFEDQRFGLIRLAQRQWAAQQVRRARQNEASPLPEILQQAVNNVASGNSQMALAILLEDAVAAPELRAVVERSVVRRNAGADIEQVAQEMASVQGLLFDIRVTNAIEGRLSVVFRYPPKSIAKLGKPILLETLAGAGAMLPEFRDWQSSANWNRTAFQSPGAETPPTSLGIEGPITTAGLRRVLSILSTEPLDVEPFLPSESKTASRDDVQDRDSKRYVNRIEKMVGEIVSGGKTNTLRQQILWTDRAAKTILRMPTRGVEPQAVEIGRGIAYDLMEIVSKFQNAHDTARSRADAVNPPPIQWKSGYAVDRFDYYTTPYGRFYRYAPFNYARINIRNNAATAHRFAREEAATANEEAKVILRKVEDKVAKMKDVFATSRYSR